VHRIWILLVEDDTDHEALALRALRKSNVQADVVVARSGPEALDCIYGPGTPGRNAWPSVIFLDLKLPNMSGFDLLRRLRGDGRTAMLPIVILTSSDERRDMEESYNLGANSYIQKPVDYDRFVDVIRETGNYWLTLNHAAVGREAAWESRSGF